ARSPSPRRCVAASPCAEAAMGALRAPSPPSQRMHSLGRRRWRLARGSLVRSFWGRNSLISYACTPSKPDHAAARSAARSCRSQYTRAQRTKRRLRNATSTPWRERSRHLFLVVPCALSQKKSCCGQGFPNLL
ncbi:uncharacterized protein SCHCODRAFT_02488068, partial [Schizophyllum commune H4-8]|uniref:uncharacterized protein n=1 Tax=Schizophyllum commune (strain H4-8 / FGSC 9210) TaxID=578458 RepID=UPI002160EE87